MKRRTIGRNPAVLAFLWIINPLLNWESFYGACQITRRFSGSYPRNLTCRVTSQNGKRLKRYAPGTWTANTVIPRLTSDHANEFFG